MGKKLNFVFILVDVNCILVCLYMLIILFVSSGIYEFFKIFYIDSIGIFGFVYFVFNEGRECFMKVKLNVYCGCD